MRRGLWGGDGGTLHKSKYFHNSHLSLITQKNLLNNFQARGGWFGLASRLKDVKSLFVFPTIGIVKIWHQFQYSILLSGPIKLLQPAAAANGQ